MEHNLDIYEQYPGVKCVYLLEKGGHNSKRLDKVIKNISKFFAKYLNEEYANNIIHEKKINLEDDDFHGGGKIIIKNTNENDKYLEKIEKKEIKILNEMKNFLFKINPEDIKEGIEDN